MVRLQAVILGIGVDTVSIDELGGITERLAEGALSRMFTERELAAAQKAVNSAVYLSTRFAVKEAVFKAVARLLPEKSFDLRLVETLNHEDGSPYINVCDALRDILGRAGVSGLHISITTEGNLATAFVIAEKTGDNDTP